MTLHPRANIHVVHVMPDHGPFASNYTHYVAAARRLPWLSVVHPDTLDLWWPTIQADPHVLVVLWSERAVPLRADRQCRIVEVYAEAFGPFWLSAHAAHLDRALARSTELDAFVVHTPRVAKHLIAAFGLQSVVMPVGWVPDFRRVPPGARTRKDVLYFGSATGKRLWSAPALFERCASLRDASGAFGDELEVRLYDALAAVTLHHSDVWTTSTWRLWQIAGTGAAAIFEAGTELDASGTARESAPDLWPLSGSGDYFVLPRVTEANVSLVARELDRLVADPTKLAESATHMTEELRAWPIERCHEALLERFGR